MSFKTTNQGVSGSFLARSIKNVLIFSLLRFLLPWIPRKEKKEHFLLVSTTGLGDSLWSTTSLAALRKTYPKATIDLLTSSVGKAVFEENPHLNQIHLWRPSFSLFKKLRNRSYETIIVLHTSQRLVLPFLKLLNISQYIGTKGRQKGLDALLTSAVLEEKEHELTRRKKLLQVIGIEKQDPELQIFLKPEEKKKFDPKPILLHTGAKDGYKRWPIEHFKALAEKLSPHPLYFIPGSDKEKKALQDLPCLHPTSIRELAAYIAEARILICNDSGPLHLACALDTPVLGLYTPTDTNLCGPVEVKTAHVLQEKPTCTPCLKKGCKEPFCLLQIAPERVYQKIKLENLC